MSDPSEPPPPGGHEHAGTAPLGEAARSLFAAVQDWAQRTRPEPPPGAAGPECQWCPLCQFARILRGEQPEVADRLAEAGTAVAGALRAVLDAAATHPPAAASEPPAGAADDQTPPRVQRIRLDESDR